MKDSKSLLACGCLSFCLALSSWKNGLPLATVIDSLVYPFVIYILVVLFPKHLQEGAFKIVVFSYAALILVGAYIGFAASITNDGYFLGLIFFQAVDGKAGRFVEFNLYNHRVLAGAVVSWIPAALMSFKFDNRLMNTVRALVIVLAIIAIFLIKSRAAYLVLLISLLPLVAMKLSKTKLWMKVFFGATCAAVCVLYALTILKGLGYGFGGLHPTISEYMAGRPQNWIYVVKQIFSEDKYLWGNGFCQMLMKGGHQPGWTIESSLISTFIQGGLVTFALALGLLVVLLKPIFGRLKDRDVSLDDCLLIFLLIAILLHNLNDDLFIRVCDRSQIHVYGVYFWLLVGYARRRFGIYPN